MQYHDVNKALYQDNEIHAKGDNNNQQQKSFRSLLLLQFSQTTDVQTKRRNNVTIRCLDISFQT